jgi:hypothetical protein
MIDQLFGVIKKLIHSRTVSSIVAIKELVTDKPINIHELTSVLDTHLPNSPEWPPGLQDFHAYHLFSQPIGVVLQAKQLNGSSFVNVATGNNWVGNDKGNPQLLLPAARPAPQPIWFVPQLAAVRGIANQLLNGGYLNPRSTNSADRAWWADFSTRYVAPPSFRWTAPTFAVYAEPEPASEAELCDVATLLALTLSETKKIAPLPIKFYWEGPLSANAYSKVSAKELNRRGAGELEELLTEAQLKALEEKRRADREQRRRKKAQSNVTEVQAEVDAPQTENEAESGTFVLVFRFAHVFAYVAFLHAVQTMTKTASSLQSEMHTLSEGGSGADLEWFVIVFAIPSACCCLRTL